MRCQEIINFCLVFIGMGILEMTVFNERILGYCLFMIGIIIGLLEIIN